MLEDKHYIVRPAAFDNDGRLVRPAITLRVKTLSQMSYGTLATVPKRSRWQRFWDNVAKAYEMNPMPLGQTGL